MGVAEVMKRLSREKFAEVWRKVQGGEQLDGEDRVLGSVMLEHDKYYGSWEMAELHGQDDYAFEAEAYPFIHATVHAIVESQIAHGQPPEVRDVLKGLTGRDVHRHEAIHRIGAILLEVLGETAGEAARSGEETGRASGPAVSAGFDLKRYSEAVRALLDEEPSEPKG